MDPGTAFEIGYFAARGKPVMVYTQVPEDLLNHVESWSGCLQSDGSYKRDRNTHAVEDFGLRENLMIEPTIDNLGVDADPVISPVPFEQVFVCCQGFAQALMRLQRMVRLADAFATPERSSSNRP